MFFFLYFFLPSIFFLSFIPFSFIISSFLLVFLFLCFSFFLFVLPSFPFSSCVSFSACMFSFIFLFLFYFSSFRCVHHLFHLPFLRLLFPSFFLYLSPPSFIFVSSLPFSFFLKKNNKFFFNSLSSLPPSFISTDKQYNVQWIVCTASKSYLNSKHLVQTFYFLESNSDSHHHLFVHSGNLPIINTLLEKSTGSSQCLL